MYVLYEGPSLIDGKQIVVCAAGVDSPSTNEKTGPMLQTYILRKGVSPTAAVKGGLDYSICGDCPHRGTETRKRSCYVVVHQGPSSVYRAYANDKPNTLVTSAKKQQTLGRGRNVRLGAYGDPGAVPTKVWDNLLKYSSGNTGYTHLWRTCDPLLSQWCMASVDSHDEMLEAQEAGWRTYRIVPELDLRTECEALCPASTEAKSSIQCNQCLACNGNRNSFNGNIMVKVHGADYRQKAFCQIGS